MKQLGDHKTIDMLDPAKRGRGRPAGDKPALTGAQRMAALRARRLEEGRVSVTVMLPVDVVAALDAFVKFKDTNKEAVIEKALRSSIMRKR